MEAVEKVVSAAESKGAFPFSAEPHRLVTASEIGVTGLSTEDVGCSNNALHGCSGPSAIQQTKGKTQSSCNQGQ